MFGDLSRFSDSPSDAVLDDLFHPLDPRVQGNEASTSGTGHENDLASELKSRMAQKQKEIEQVGTPNGGLLKMVLDMQDDVIDIDASVIGRLAIVSFISRLLNLF
jgi:hypothetical protein